MIVTTQVAQLQWPHPGIIGGKSPEETMSTLHAHHHEPAPILRMEILMLHLIHTLPHLHMIEEKMIGIDGSMRNGTDNLGETIMALTTALRKEGNGVMIGEPGSERREGEVGRLDTNMIVVTVHIDLMRDLRGRGTHLTA